MKKIMTVIMVLFATVAMTFGQQVCNGTTFGLKVDGVNVPDFDVTYNPDNKYIILVYRDILDNVELTPTVAIFQPTLTHTYSDNINNVGIVMTKINYVGFLSGYEVYFTASSSSYTIPQYTADDTLSSFNNGVGSVDTDSFYDNGFTAGVASVDTSIYFYNGQLSINIDSIFEVGFNYGKTTDVLDIVVDNSFNVYPNPVTQGDNVTVTMTDFLGQVDVYNTIGQKVFTSTETVFTTSTLEKGLYILIVTNSDGYVVTDTNRHTAKIIVQ